jgi:ribonuclease Z
MSRPGSTEQIGNAKLKAFSVYHGNGKVDALAFRLETTAGKFAYSGDTGDCEGIRTACQDADIFVCEASARINDTTYHLNYGHLTPQQAGEIAKQGGVKKLILVHYQGFDSDEDMIKEVEATGFKGEVQVGKDFQTVNT